MKKILIFLFFAAQPMIISATTVKMDLSAAIKNNTVKAEGINFKGGYIGKTTKLMIANNTKSVVQLRVDIGVIFKPDDDAYQPMVLAGEEMVMIMPLSKGEIDVETFCGNAPGHCPSESLHYTFSHVANDTLIKILQFIKKNSLFDYLGQDAVWAITNGHDIGYVYDNTRDAISKQLQELLCATTGRPKPEYYTVTTKTQVPDEPAYVPKTMKIVAEFEIRLDTPKALSLGIYNDSGVMVQKVFENLSFGKSGHRFGVEFEAEGALQGKYYIRLKEGEMVLQEKMFKVNH